MQLRKDYILNRWSYINTKRGKRPHNFALSGDHTKDMHPKDCPFCAGHEKMTPPERGRVEKSKGKWLVRWFHNKYPIVSLCQHATKAEPNPFYQTLPAHGIHEIIVETPGQEQMAELSYEHLAVVLKVYNYRIKELSKEEGIRYVLVFKNKGKAAGASLVHSHSQVIALNQVPSLVTEKLKAFDSFDECPYCRIIQDEAGGPRKAFENHDFIAFTPYAPRFNYEIWIFPKAHMRNMDELREQQYMSLAEILHWVLVKLSAMGAPYCFYIHYAPEKNDFHWHIEILPRLNIMAGFELGGGDSVVTINPEDAAQFYKNEH